ncbi:MAG: hypothetical protein F4X11_07060 [Acidobacteria bacterium]|nr:hypothetical protein [Acidobacteriota bacterium]
MKAPSALLALLAAGPLACIESPGAPTQEPARTSRPADPRFDDRFWRELIFNEHDAPGQGDFVRVLSNPSPNVYVRLGGAGGTRRVVADDRLAHIREVLPLLAEQITGRPYDGRIESGIEERGDREGWITVRFVTPEEYPDIGASCGLATPGADPGSIWFARGNDECFRNGYFRRLFAHELGHAFGLWHVGDRAAMMSSETGNDIEWFTERERYHAQLAYEVGRGAAYCGWPFGSACAGGT